MSSATSSSVSRQPVPLPMATTWTTCFTTISRSFCKASSRLLGPGGGSGLLVWASGTGAGVSVGGCVVASGAGGSGGCVGETSEVLETSEVWTGTGSVDETSAVLETSEIWPGGGGTAT